MNNIYIYTCIFILILSSCRASKQVVSDQDIKQFEVTSLYDSIISHYGDFQTIKFNFIAHPEDIKSLPQIKGSMRIKKDSIIWISINAMTIELFRTVITNDSIKFYSKMQKIYFGNSIDSLFKITDFKINYKTIESILVNELFFCQQEQNFDTLELFKQFQINKKNNKFIIHTHSKKDFKKNDTLELLQTWDILNKSFRISEVSISEENSNNTSKKIKLLYSNFEEIQNIIFPTKINIKAKMPNKNYTLDIHYNKIIFNEDLEFPFNPSDKYKKIDLK